MPPDTAVTDRWVYAFGGGIADGDASMKDLLGGKGANLAEMSALGLPVPPGFTITTEACVHYYSHDSAYPAALKDQVLAGLATVEKLTGKKFGDAALPLLVSVRSGLPAASMPRHDGYRAEPRPQRRDRRGLSLLSGDQLLRLRQLPPLHPDVFRRSAGPGSPHVRGDPRRQEGPARRHHRHRP